MYTMILNKIEPKEHNNTGGEQTSQQVTRSINKV